MSSSSSGLTGSDQSIVDQMSQLLAENAKFELAMKKSEVHFQQKADAAKAKNQ